VERGSNNKRQHTFGCLVHGGHRVQVVAPEPPQFRRVEFQVAPQPLPAIEWVADADGRFHING
jgi:hypothetical protein